MYWFIIGIYLIMAIAYAKKSNMGSVSMVGICFGLVVVSLFLTALGFVN